jgi:large subunit ribosomal protein L24
MSSIQPRKQRKALYNAPLHRRGKQMHAHLSEELLVKYGKRSFPVRINDTVRVVRGKGAGTTGKVLGIDRARFAITIDGVSVAKADGTEKPKPIHPSDVVITKLDLSDKLRREKLGATEADVAPEDKGKPARKAKGGAAKEGRPEPAQPTPAERQAAKARAKAEAAEPEAEEQDEEGEEESQ